MPNTTVILTVTLQYDDDDVREAEDFQLLDADQTPEAYVRDALGSFLANEVNNCNEYPATVVEYLQA